MTAVAVIASLLAPISMAVAAGPDYSRKWAPPNTPLPQTKSVNGKNVGNLAAVKPAHDVPPTWQPPKNPRKAPMGHAEVRLGAAPAAAPRTAGGQSPQAGPASEAANLPVAIAPLEGSALAGQTVQVEVVDPKTAGAAGIPGPVLKLSHDASKSLSGPVRVSLDVSRLAESYGADWASRARIVALPACSLTTPQVAGCLQQTPLESHLDSATKKLVADVALPGDDGTAHTQIQSLQAAPSGSQPMVLGAVSGTSSGSGTYSATPLNISQAWAAGSSSGAFTYSYPIQTPPSLAGAGPQVALAYDSASVDGKTSATNSQASWIGDGWDYSPGFVERSYQPCSKDGITGSGDECWAGANLTLSLAGHSGELVPDDASCQSGAAAAMEQSACTWRIKGDDGSKVQFLTGATNGTWNGSYIKVTDTAGTVYYFGLAHLPDASGNPSTVGPDSGSAWTMPVYSPNTGDPCYDPAKGKASWCQTAWRWNLDYVVDPHGNLTTYTYTPEANFYSRGAGQNNGTGTSTSYTRGGVPATIGYGQLLSDQIAAAGAYKPAAKIVFTSDERCTTSTTACNPANRTSANAVNWPDVPMDLQCAQTGTCTNRGPSFWTTKWLTTITTQVRYNGAYQDVDSYAFTHRFVDIQDPIEPTKVPWLDSVQRTGKDPQAGGGELHLPQPVSFTETLMPNRVDGTNLVPSRPAYNRPRIQLITTETGSTIGVDYYGADCSRVNNVMPDSADSDTRSCYNVKWHQPNEKPGDAPVDDWFQRYPVKTVTVNPGTPGSTAMTRTYTYGASAWHRNDSPFTDTQDRTWDQFRGYATVTTVSGSGQDGPKSQTTATYLQGMDGDITASGTRSMSVTGPMSGQVTDSDWLSGQVLEQDTYTQAGGTITAATVNTSSGPVTTATHNRSGLPALVARYNATTVTSTSKALKADGTWVTSTSTTTTDSDHNNRPRNTLSTADGTPDICVRRSYSAGPDAQVTSLVSEQLSISGTNACTATATDQNTLSWTRSYYDGKPLGQAGTKAEPTSAESLDRFNGTTPVHTVDATYTYDAYGRMLTTTDPKVTDSSHTTGATVTTAYTAPQAGEIPTGVSVTSPAPAGASDANTGRTTVTALNSARGLPKTTTDPNGRVTAIGYDALGRTTGVWLPGRDTGQSANTSYTYAVPGVVSGHVVPPTITTSTLTGVGSAGNYSTATSIQIMDGLGRAIQTQSPPALSLMSGRIITDAFYDSQGRVLRANNSWYNNAAAPSTTLYQTTDQEAPNQTHTVYDGLSRPVTNEFIAYGVIQSTTATAYPGADRTDITPPTGSTPITTISDARGRTAQAWQYKTATATGNTADADITTYTYTAAGQPATHKDAAGNTWSYTYDVRGRQVSATDPDTGNSTIAYDSAGRVASTTDARNRTITSAYDLLGRPTATYDGTTVDPAKQLTARTYDTVVTGQPATSTRYVGGANGAAYTSAVLSYDTAYHPTKTTVTVPGAETGATSPFTYTYQAAFDPVTGLKTADNRPTVGDIAGETFAYTYDTNGLLTHYGVGSAQYDVGNDYDAYGRPIRTNVNPYNTQVVVTNTYDESTGRPLSQYVDKQTAPTGSVQQTTYAYDPSGRITAIRTVPDNDPSKTDLQCFGYDYLSRLTTAWSDTGALTLQPQPKVGNTGACANATPTSGVVAPAKTTVGGYAPYWQDYTYDLTGNRKTLLQHDPAGDTTKDTTTTQTFPTAGTVNNGNGSGGPHALTLTSAVTGASTTNTYPKYDAAGNTTSQYSARESTTNLSWTAEGKLDTYDPPVQIQGIGGKCIDTRGGSSANGTPEQIYTCNTAAGGQKFNTSGNLLKTFNRCVTAMGTTDGSAVQLQPCNGTAAQTWTPRPDGTILNGAANLCLTVPGNVTTNSTALTVATCGTTVPAGQKWTVPNQDTTYVYDADGNQLIRHNPGKTTITLGGDELTYDTTTKTTTGTRYYPMPGGISLIRQSTGATIQISDLHGTAGLAIDALDPSLPETRRPTDPFGNPRGTKPTTWAGDHGYVDGTKDDTTGLTNLGARQYQPTTGRFINPDPLLDPADPQQWNGYAYSNNNPVNLSDPSGLCPRDLCQGYGQNPGSLPGVHGTPTDEDHDGRGESAADCSSKIPGCPGYKPGHWESVACGPHACSKNKRYVSGEEQESRNQFAAGYWGLKGDKDSKDYKDGEHAGILVQIIAQILEIRAHATPIRIKGCSFSPETRVLLEDGTTKEIAEIAVGDRVQAADPEAGTNQGARPVTATLIDNDNDLIDLTISTSDGKQEKLHTTSRHPFWDETSHSWVPAAQLPIGDTLATADGERVRVAAVDAVPGSADRYNLTVADLHTYYVVTDNGTSTLVHNDCFGGTFAIPGKKWVNSYGGSIEQQGITATLGRDGILETVVRAPEGSPVRGTQMLNDAITAFEASGREIEGIRGSWTEGKLGDNLDSFNKAMKKGDTEEEAVWETFTGKYALRNGYTEISIDWESRQGTPGNYTEFVVNFMKPRK